MPAGDHGGGSSDLGRRIAARRAELGLTAADVASAAGMDPRYLHHLETEPSAVASLPVLRSLARALLTTPAALLGAVVFRPPGSVVAQGASALETLPPDECWRLLAPGGVGRIVFDSARGPVALPVNFRMLDHLVVFRTTSFGQIAGLVGPGQAGFEVDRIDDALRQAWSVVLTGHVRSAHEGDELERARSLDVSPWADGQRETFLLFESAEVTGRRIVEV